MKQRVLITCSDSEVAARLDHCVEVIILDLDDAGRLIDENTFVLDAPSADEICRLILSEKVQTVVCGGLTEEHYQFLTWKKINVHDGVIGNLDRVIESLANETIRAGLILRED